MKAKKLVALTLALLLVFTCSMMALAATIDQNGSASVPVKAAVKDSTPLYSADVSWGTPSFTYDWGTWSGSAYTGGGWTGSDNVITVVNHSNREIAVTAAVQPDGSKIPAGVTVSAPLSIANLPRADQGAAEADRTATATITLDDAPTAKPGDPIGVDTIGTINITIAGTNPTP